ncbi:MAG TPA: hypothetical protein P5571_02615 [Candidatus Krumholzibacteria bacterium]|nr:hypothetical protein [Candidatus Krumholzibacteria bacterium]HRX50237.1 hypothetical protein [Candidatus Krumholzibacteria bacterium]
MKKLLAFMAVALLASGAMAQIDPDADGMGVYFDMGATEVCASTVAPFQQIVAYLCITNPSASAGVSGWEAYVTVTGGVVAGAWTLSAGLDVDPSAEGFQVGIGTGGLALPAAPSVVLATYSAFVQAAGGEVAFYCEGVPGSTSFDGTPGYAGGSDAGDLRACQVSSGTGLGLPVARVNGDCDIVANEDMTFSNVKALFR